MKICQKIYLPFKRLIAFFGSILGILLCLLFLWWWIILINLIVTKGHPVFLSERIGKNGKKFKVLKFRSMFLNANPKMTSENVDLENNVTKFGRFLRKTSLDETLQLFNIFVGQMSFIGPRPLIDVGVDKITIEKRKENDSIKLRPGLGGYAQVHGRVNVSPEEKAKLDGYYYDHISLWLDIKLFFLSLFKSAKKEDIEKNKNIDENAQ